MEEAVAALGSTTELATHLFRECWAPRIQGRDGGRPGGALAVGRLHQSGRTFLTADDRVEKVAAFVAQHFKEKVLPLGYKAFLVGVNREACAKYKRALDKLLPPEWSEAVYTESAADIIDRPLVAELQLSSGREADVRLLFKKPTENPKILIVTDKLLTGYDAPLLYCMYLDKPMRDHVLLQAIARVNRPFTRVGGCSVVAFQLN